MKETNLTRQRSADIQRGLTDPSAARSLSWIEEMTVDGDVVEGSVVVVQNDGTVTYTSTVGDGRPTGVCLDDADDGETVQVVFGGPVAVVNLTASGTAGDSISTSTTPGEAATATSNAFGYLTSTGTTPSAFLWGGRGGGIGGGGSGTDASEPVFDHGNMGSTETLDLADGTWHRGTLNADCTITVTGFTVDEGLVVVFEVTQDGTGGWAVTWDADVQFIGDDQPDQTAGSVTVFLLFSSAGDSTIYGAKVGTAAALSSPLTTKGDMWGYDTADARVPVGTDTYLLVADSTDAQGVVWKDPQTTGHWEILMDGGSPYAPLDDGTGTDYLYVWIP